jgi:acyl-coenzyme A thioesterase PaaI-like protein
MDGHQVMAHGGTISTLFDESLSLGALLIMDKAFVTGSTKVNY